MIEPVISLGKKTVVAMVHLPALPGSPDYDTEVGMSKILDAVISDLEALQSGRS
jgi:Predicted TIM-barrel enzyme